MEGVAFIGGFALILAGLYFVFFRMKDYLARYEAEEVAQKNGTPVNFHVATSNAAIVPLVLRCLEEARTLHPDIQYVLTMGDERALLDAVENGESDVAVVSQTVSWMEGVHVSDLTVRPSSYLLDEGNIALKPLDTSEQTLKVLFRRAPSALVDEFVQALCAQSL